MSKSKKFDFFNFEAPSYTDTIKISGLSTKEMLVFAHDVAYELDWVIEAINDYGFVASSGFSFRSNGERIEIKITDEEITITSQVAGSQRVDLGKNQDNVVAFYEKFNKMIEAFDPAEVEEKYQKLITQIEEFNNEAVEQPKKNGFRAFLDIFIPRDGYVITPILININILVFILMVLNGVNFMVPSIEDLVLWGGNLTPLIAEGQWWRIVTSTFLHGGIIHLFVNMYALLYVGSMLEVLIGKKHFLCAYLISGIVASLTSCYWHENTVSVGASGAIFGMYGVFLSLLTTKIIDSKPLRKQLLKQMAFFVLFNLGFGMKAGIDNAAHIGGLLSGLAVGFAYIPGLTKPEMNLKGFTIGVLATLTLFGSYAALGNIKKSDMVEYNQDMNEIGKHEAIALAAVNDVDSKPAEQACEQLQTLGIDNLQVCINMLNFIESYNIPDELKNRNNKLKHIFYLRIKIYQAFQKRITTQSDAYDTEINQYRTALKQAVEEFRKEEE